MKMNTVIKQSIAAAMKVFGTSLDRRVKIEKWLANAKPIDFIEAITINKWPWLINSSTLGILKVFAEKRIKTLEINGCRYSVWTGSMFFDDEKILAKIGIDTSQLNKYELGMFFSSLEVVIIIDSNMSKGKIYIVDVRTNGIE